MAEAALAEERPNTVDKRILTFYETTENSNPNVKGKLVIEELETFRNPHAFIRKLAEAGFEAYEDKTDEYNQLVENKSEWMTRCFKCQLVLSDWKEEDLPMDEHFKAMSGYCPLVKEFYKHLNTVNHPGAAGDNEMEVDGESRMQGPEDGGSDNEMDTGSAPNAECERCHHKEDMLKIKPCGHIWCRFCFNNKTSKEQEHCPECRAPVESCRVLMPEKSAKALATKEQRRKEHLMLAKLYTKCKETNCGSRDKIVLYECTHIVCVHYKDHEQCPCCNQPVDKTKTKSAHDSVIEGLAKKLGK